VEEGRVADLEEMKAIKQLKARYFRLMDTKEWDSLVDVFCPDVVVDTSDDGGQITHGASEFLHLLRAGIEHVTTVHHGHTPEIVLTSATTARGIWAMEDELWWPEGAPLRHMHGYGHYLDTYEKTSTGWRIKSMTLTRLTREID
jgi:hypothetical protein